MVTCRLSSAIHTSWPPGSANVGWPVEPTAALLPGRVEGFPAGTQRAANAAQRLLSQAVGYWDVRTFRDGDRFLRNQGTGGELLDMRLGSADVANSNDPQYLAPEDRGYAYTSQLGGAAVGGLQVPHESAFEITGDIDLRVFVALDLWRPGPGRPTVVFNKISSGSPCWVFAVNQNSTLQFQASPDGLGMSFSNSNAAMNIENGRPYWIRVTMAANTGGGNSTVSYYTSSDGIDWVQLGTSVQITAPSIFPGTAKVSICGFFENTLGTTGAKTYRAQILNGINGTVVLDVDCDAITSGAATEFTALTGQRVSIMRGDSGRKTVAMPAKRYGGQPVLLHGTDDYMECQNNWQYNLLDFDKSQSFTVVAIARQWSSGPNNSLLLSSGASSVNGYGITVTSPTTNNFVASEPTANLSAACPSRASGSINVSTGVYDRTAFTLTPYTGIIAGSPVALTNEAPNNTTRPMTIGRESSATSYTDCEFYAAAVFRRTLTKNEIALLTDAFDYDSAGSPFDMQYLVIAGGGGGAGSNQRAGGGGGAGGYRCNVPGESSGGGQTSEPALTLRRGVRYTVTVGSGGAGGTAPAAAGSNTGSNGGDSVFAAITSIGGGGGGGDGGGVNGSTGGSGGGGFGGGSFDGTGTNGGLSTFAQGFNGRAGFGSTTTGADRSSGGGGGAGGQGSAPTSTAAGSGGNGIASSITGTSVTRGGGGGGSRQVSGGTGAGGAGGGGAGTFNATGTAGTNGTGGGGGAAGSDATGFAGGAGGSGVVILKYPDSITATFSSGVTQTTTTSGGFNITTVTATSSTDQSVIFG